MNYILIIVVMLVGFLFGVGISAIAVITASDGKLIVTRDDQGEGPYLFLELDESATRLEHKKTAVFNIVKRMK